MLLNSLSGVQERIACSPFLKAIIGETRALHLLTRSLKCFSMFATDSREDGASDHLGFYQCLNATTFQYQCSFGQFSKRPEAPGVAYVHITCRGIEAL